MSKFWVGSFICAKSSSQKCEQIGSISLEENLFNKLHRDSRCHGVTRLFRQVKIKNWRNTVADVTKVCKSCEVCYEIKPNFYKPKPRKLIRATQPFERFLVDFKETVSKPGSRETEFY